MRVQLTLEQWGGLGVLTPRRVKNPRITSDSPKTYLLPAHCGPEALPKHKRSMDTYLVLYVLHIVFLQ